MQNIDPDSELWNLDLLSDDEYLADELLLPIADVEAAFYGQNPQALDAEPIVLEVPSSSPLGSGEISHVQYGECLATLSDVFPGISSEYVRELYDTWREVPRPHPHLHQVIHAFQDMTLQILEASSYPKEKDRINELKRKRSQALHSDGEDSLQWKGDRKGQESAGYVNAASWELQAEFVKIPANVINRKMQEEGSCYAVYLALAQDEWAFKNTGKSPYPRLKHCRKIHSHSPYHRKPGSHSYSEPELQREIQAARERTAKLQAKRKAEVDAAEAEAAAEKLHRDNGDVFECQCCFEEFTISKITHCDGDVMHYFCLECAKRNANNEIGNLRYKLICMSGDVCAASFSRNERHRFLDENTLKALDRIQLQAEVKEAGVDIIWCPFCDFGATCPPVYIDKEFRCRNTDCEKVSCRNCKVESHVPLSCDEWKKENQISERHVLEEACTAALLKQCPKCHVQIIKDHGCNRLTCPCGGVMCDFCGKDITGIGYGHFKRNDGTNESGNKCPTFDDSDARRRDAVKTAEADALKEVRARNPDLNSDALKLNFHDDAPSVLAKNDIRQEEFLAEVIRIRAAAERRPAIIPPPVAEAKHPIRLVGPDGYHGGLGIQHQRALVPPFHPGVAPIVHLPEHHQNRHRPRPIIPPVTLPPVQFAANPAIREGFAVSREPAYQHPSHLPAYGPVAFPDLYPRHFIEQTPGPQYPYFQEQIFPEEVIKDEVQRYEDQLQLYNEFNEFVQNRIQRYKKPVEDQVRGYAKPVEDQARRYKEFGEDQHRRFETLSENQTRRHKKPAENQVRRHEEPVEDEVRKYREFGEDRHRRFENLLEDSTLRHKKSAKDQVRKYEKAAQDQVRSHRQSAEDRHRRFEDPLAEQTRRHREI